MLRIAELPYINFTPIRPALLFPPHTQPMGRTMIVVLCGILFALSALAIVAGMIWSNRRQDGNTVHDDLEMIPDEPSRGL